MKYFVKKRQWFYRKELKVRQFFRTGSLPPLRKSIETELNQNNFRHLHLLLFVFAADEVFMINFYNCTMKQGMQYFLFGVL